MGMLKREERRKGVPLPVLNARGSVAVGKQELLTAWQDDLESLIRQQIYRHR